jgi:4-methylaminobutanoate oxidase (formaldehyde-forming)
MTQRILVIGGGVIGTSIAWHLTEAGAGDVTLVERDRLGSGTTWHSAGNITWKPSSHHDAPVLDALETIERLHALTGQDTGWLTTGRMFIALSDEMRQTFEGFDRVAHQRGIPSRWLEAAEARQLNPLLDPSATKGIWLNPVSGRLNPADLTAAYAKAARMGGARIAESAGVERILTQGSRATGAVINGETIAAETIVVAAGLWSRDLLLPLGTALPQWPCEHMYLIADVAPRLTRETPSFVAPDHLIYGREEVGGFLVGFFDENAKARDPATIPDPFSFTLFEPDADQIAPYYEGAIGIFPALADAPVRRFINGPESFTPDGLPLVGPVTGVAGLYVATAMNSVGVTWSAMVGETVASLVVGRTPRFDTRAFSDEVDTGSSIENATKQRTRAPTRFNRVGTRSSAHALDRFGDRSRNTAWLATEVSGVVSRGYRSQNQ